MKRQKFITLVNNEHKFAKNTYVHGRILGIADVICELDGGARKDVGPDGKTSDITIRYGGWWANEDESVRYLTMYCTAKQYKQFKTYVEGDYPGLLTFYYDLNKITS